jgi:hypothetical protein
MEFGAMKCICDKMGEGGLYLRVRRVLWTRWVTVHITVKYAEGRKTGQSVVL